jgi:hypothetical protein
MRDRFSHSMIMAAIAAAGGSVTCVCITPTWAQAPVVSVTTPPATLKTPWGEPDLQGIWKECGSGIFYRSTASRIGQRTCNDCSKAGGAHNRCRRL